MKNEHTRTPRISNKPFLTASAVVLLIGFFTVFPTEARETLTFVGWSLVQVAPLIIPGILIAAWVSASGASERIAEIFNGNLFATIVTASAIGAITPVCGVAILPLMAGLLAAGVPLAPVMAFWLSSPVTDPVMLATTAATLGLSFAIGKTVAAFGLGLLGGSVTGLLGARPWVRSALRENALIGRLRKVCRSETIEWAIWRSPGHLHRFHAEFMATARLVLICLIPAFAAEHVLQSLLEPESLSAYVGGDVWWAIPAAVFVGAPAYLDGYAALPLTRSLMDHGMSSGAAMAFLVSGGAVSIWGAVAIFPVLKPKPFLLYIALAIVGSLASGWIFEMIA